MPRTNGKIKRFWKIIESDLLENIVFDLIEYLQNELSQCLYYYNNLRPYKELTEIYQ